MLAYTALVFALAWLRTVFGGDKSQQGAVLSDTERITRWKGGYSFQGIQTFAHLPHSLCLIEQDAEFDLGIIGVPFDTSVAYRPGVWSETVLRHCLFANSSSDKPLIHRRTIWTKSHPWCQSAANPSSRLQPCARSQSISKLGDSH